MCSRIQRALTMAFVFPVVIIYSSVHGSFLRRPVKFTLAHQGIERSCLLYRPRGIHGQTELRPLVFVLHGGGGTHRGIIRLTKGRFNTLADRDGFFVVYPQGVEKAWNEGRGDPISGAHCRGIDDVGFFASLIDHLLSKYPIDPNRVFVTGISNGGLMSLRLGCSLPDRIRAIAPVTASIPSAILPLCRSESAVSLAVFNGTEDPLVPYYGGQIKVFRQERGEVLSTDETIRIWLSKNRCTLEPQVTELPDLTDDGTRVVKVEYAQCSANSKVLLYRIDGGGHTWPGGRQYLSVRLIGRTSRDINACDEIWSFFRNLN